MCLTKVIKVSRWVDVLIISKFSNFSYVFIFGILGFLKFKMRKKINIQSKFKKIRISGQDLSLYSTYNQILNNLFYGVLVGHSKYLELKGVGFKFKLKNNKLFLILGYSHVISYVLPSNISVELLNTKLIKLFSNNLMILNKVIFYLKKLKKTDVYKGKGILLKGEVVLIKEGKKSNTF